jgi:hypothetical protein
MSIIVNVHFRKPGKGKIVEKTYFPRSLQFSDVVADNTECPQKKRRVHNSLIYRRILIIYTPN